MAFCQSCDIKYFCKSNVIKYYNVKYLPNEKAINQVWTHLEKTFTWILVLPHNKLSYILTDNNF